MRSCVWDTFSQNVDTSRALHLFITYPGTCLGCRYISMLVVSKVSFSILNVPRYLLSLLIQRNVAVTVIAKVYEFLVLDSQRARRCYEQIKNLQFNDRMGTSFVRHQWRVKCNYYCLKSKTWCSHRIKTNMTKHSKSSVSTLVKLAFTEVRWPDLKKISKYLGRRITNLRGITVGLDK